MAIYTYTSDLSTIATETLIDERNETIAAYDALKDRVFAEVTALIEKNVPGYKASLLGNNVLYLDAIDAKRRLDIEIHFGQKLFNSDENEFRINPATIGSFNIDMDSDERRYFIAIGNILTNSEFHNTLRGTLFNWHFEVLQLIESVRAIGNELNRRANIAKKETERMEMMDHFNENIRPHFNQDLTDM